MKIFVINLKRSVERKKLFIKNWNPIIDKLSFCEAIDGSLLSEEELSSIVLNYPGLKLTKGEIGCALSHLMIYKRMVKEQIPIALILEDDAILKIGFEPFKNLLHKIEQKKSIPSQSVLFLQNCAETPLNGKKVSVQITKELRIEEVRAAWLSHGYVITLEAAQKLINFLLPIRYEADCWEAFRIGTDIKLLATIPPVILSSDPSFQTSTLHEERLLLVQERKEIRSKQLKREIELSQLRTQFKLFPINRFIKRNKFFPLNRFLRKYKESLKKY